MKAKTVSKALLIAAIVVTAMGAISYMTATGKAVIGPDPESVDAERAEIAISTFWWALACLAGCAATLVRAPNREGKA